MANSLRNNDDGILIGFKELKSAYYTSVSSNDNSLLLLIALSIYLRFKKISHIKIVGELSYNSLKSALENLGISKYHSKKIADIYKKRPEYFSSLFKYNSEHRNLNVMRTSGYWENLCLYKSEDVLKEEELRSMKYSKAKHLYFRIDEKDLTSLKNMAQALDKAMAGIAFYENSKFVGSKLMEEDFIFSTEKGLKFNGSSRTEVFERPMMSITTLALCLSVSRQKAAKIKKELVDRMEISFFKNEKCPSFDTKEAAEAFFWKTNKERTNGYKALSVKQLGDKFYVPMQGTDSFELQNGTRLTRIIPRMKSAKILEKEMAPGKEKEEKIKEMKKNKKYYVNYHKSGDRLFKIYPDKVKEECVNGKKEAYNNKKPQIDTSNINLTTVRLFLLEAAKGSIPPEFCVWSDEGKLRVWTEAYGEDWVSDKDPIVECYNDTLRVSNVIRLTENGKHKYMTVDGEYNESMQEATHKLFNERLIIIADKLLNMMNTSDQPKKTVKRWLTKEAVIKIAFHAAQSEGGRILQENIRKVNKKLHYLQIKTGLTEERIREGVESMVKAIMDKNNCTTLEAWRYLERGHRKAYYDWKKDGGRDGVGFYTFTTELEQAITDKNTWILESTDVAETICTYLSGIFMSSSYYCWFPGIQTRIEYDMMCRIIRREKEERKMKRIKKELEKQDNS